MAYFNAGESCAAAPRFLVQRESMEELTELLCAFADALVLGDTALPETTFGPLITGQHRENVEGFLERRGKHARVVRGGNRPDSPGFFLEPTIVTGVHQDDELVQKEVFGPVITIQQFDGEDEAVALANGTQYGLTGSVWTRDLARGLRMTRELEAGTVWINTHCELTCETPFGGYRRSGLGKEFGAQAINDYSQLKHVMANIQPQ
jgi:betaine-aldehyde dehydrogenase